MLDDIIEAAIDILGDILEAVLSSKRTKRNPTGRKKVKQLQQKEPWERSDQAAPWET